MRLRAGEKGKWAGRLCSVGNCEGNPDGATSRSRPRALLSLVRLVGGGRGADETRRGPCHRSIRSAQAGVSGPRGAGAATGSTNGTTAPAPALPPSLRRRAVLPASRVRRLGECPARRPGQLRVRVTLGPGRVGPWEGGAASPWVPAPAAWPGQGGARQCSPCCVPPARRGA